MSLSGFPGCRHSRCVKFNPATIGFDCSIESLRKQNSFCQILIDDLSVKVGEKIVLRRFTRFEVGEGIEKVAQVSFAEEVASAIADA